MVSPVETFIGQKTSLTFLDTEVDPRPRKQKNLTA